MDEAQTILADIDAFIASQGMAATTFGQKAVRDSKLVKRLRSGRPITTATLQKIRDFIRAHSSDEVAA